MPYLKFDSPSGFADNKGSCDSFVNYLSKEDFRDESLTKEFFFNHNSEEILDYQVIDAIDNNRKGLSKTAAKFYTGSINFSEEELMFIGNDPEKIKDYSIKVMEQYANQFNKGISISDINWFGKIEYHRYYKGDEEEVKNGTRTQGDEKNGLQTHVHFLIGHMSKNGKKKLSPKTNHRDTQKGPIKGGFNRDEFKQRGEGIFDQMFGYLRPLEESYNYYKVKSNGAISDRVEIIQQHSNEKVKKETYLSQSEEQKEFRINQLANYICHGIDKNNLKKIDTEALLRFEKRTDYNGYIYRSLVNLNRMCKQGKTPNEYDLTQKVIGFASYLELRKNFHHSSGINKPISFIQERSNEFKEVFSTSFSLSNSISDNYSDEDPAEMQRRKKKKKGSQKRDQGMSI
ncbi:MAG: hypothetical protein HXX16_09270 [Bacteroidales bacterium]|nr:hypothetical protein [Bacteroidales bacterium]